MATCLHRVVADLLPADIAVAQGAIDAADGAVFPVEAAAVVRAVEKRRREFGAGRAYARQALATLGCPSTPIPVGPGRRPLWPHGFVGSISHSDHLCAAVVGFRTRYIGLGIDLESDTPIDDESLRAHICRPEEMARGGADRTKLLFVIKEAVFKAYYPEGGAFLEFSDISVEVDPVRLSFVAALARPELPRLSGRALFAGRFGFAESHVAAAVAIAEG